MIRNTPPSLPMSSPISTTFGSLSNATRRPALSAFAIVIAGAHQWAPSKLAR